MTDEMYKAKKAEIRALDKEMVEEEKKIYASYGLSYPPKYDGRGINDWSPPELKELNRKGMLKLKAIQDKYKE